MKRNALKTDWTTTPEGQKKYQAARAEAQKLANESGFDYRLERNDPFKTFMIGMLPARKNRYGFETRCEVVSCENLSKCQPGHGPVSK